MEDDPKSVTKPVDITWATMREPVKTEIKDLMISYCITNAFAIALAIFVVFLRNKSKVPEVKMVSMQFTAELDVNSASTQQTHHLHLVSGRWDLLIRVPGKLVGNYMCPQGNLQASFFYKNITLVTSSIQSYKLESGSPQLLNVSVVASKDDLSGAIGKEIMKAIKERNEVRFGSRLFLTDCREETKGTMSYECDEAKLRFEPGADKIKATTFGNHPICIISL